MTNKKSTFETWFRELEQLLVKFGIEVDGIDPKAWRIHFDNGKTPNEAIAFDLQF